MRLCSVEGCDREHAARGWCVTHLSRWKRTGTVELAARPVSMSKAAVRQRHIRKARPKHGWVGQSMPCPACGKAFTQTRDRMLACSMSCAARVRYGPKAARPAPAERRCVHCQALLSGLRVKYCGNECYRLHSRKPLVERPCRYCGKAFVPLQSTERWQHATKVCSVDCQNEERREASRIYSYAARARRKVRMRKPEGSALVVRKRIYERDGWRCHLCSKPVKRDAVVPHPQAPTIDHLIPLAAGGTHEPHNVRTAHFICNSKRGAGGVVQLLLVA